MHVGCSAAKMYAFDEQFHFNRIKRDKLRSICLINALIYVKVGYLQHLPQMHQSKVLWLCEITFMSNRIIDLAVAEAALNHLRDTTVCHQNYIS